MLITEYPRVIAQEIEKRVEAVTKFIILKTLSNLTAPPQDGGTPVKTGFASASWICSVGTPSAKVGGSKENVDHGPQEAGQAELHAYKLSQGAAFLTNNVWYLFRLNYGWSPQASPGFVERAHERARAEAEVMFRE